MDLMALLDKFENYVTEATRLPLTNKILVDEEEIYSYIDEIKGAFPDELQQSKWVLKERERLLAEAKKESELIIEDAKNQIARLSDDHAITLAAQAKAQEYIEKAKSVAQEIRSGAIEYADGILSSLEKYLAETNESIKKGRLELEHTKDSASQLTSTATR